MHTIGHHIDDALNLSEMDLESSLLLAMNPSIGIGKYVEAIEPIEAPLIETEDIIIPPCEISGLRVLEKSLSFLTRDMDDGIVTKHLELDLGHHEYPLLESTIVENHPACNQYCMHKFR